MKFIIFVGLFIGLLLIHNPNILFYTCIGLLLVYFLLTGYPFVLLLLFASPFLIIFLSSTITMMLFGEGQTTLFQYGVIHVTEESFYRGIHLGMRSIVFGLLGLLFALTTRPVSMFYSMMQQLKLPPKIAYSFMTAIRLLPMIAEEFSHLKKGLKIRGMEYKKGIHGFYQKIQLFTIPVLAQSIRRAYRIAIAMEAKQFTGNRDRTFYYQIGFTRYDTYFVIFLLATLLITFYMSEQLPILQVKDVLSL